MPWPIIEGEHSQGHLEAVGERARGAEPLPGANNRQRKCCRGLIASLSIYSLSKLPCVVIAQGSNDCLYRFRGDKQKFRVDWGSKRQG